MALYRPEPSWQREHDKNTNVVTNDPLAVIYNEGQWRINNVSPLYNLQYDAVKLKQYGAKIRQAIVSSIASNSNIKYSVKFEAQPHLKYEEDDANGLMITISSTQESISKTKVAYTAVMLSWGESTRLEGTTHLPYMLERGEQKLGMAIKATLQKIFDCNIKQFSFTQLQLLEFGFNILEYVHSRDVEPFTLTYKTPQSDVKDKLTLTFDIEDVKIIWKGVQEEVIRKSETINLAYQILQNQIFYMFTLDINAFDLCEVATSKAGIKCNGIVKMKTPEIVNCVFTMLNEVSDVLSIKDLSDVSNET